MKQNSKISAFSAPSRLLKACFKLVLTLGLFMTLSAGAALAASTYAVTETTATVGTAQTYEIEYTVDIAEQTWADGDTLTVQLPANYPQWGSLTFTVEHDDDTTNDGTGETSIGAGGGNGQYAVSTDTITIKWDDTSWTTDANDTIRILITASAAPTYADATSTFTFGGATVAGDTDPTGTDDVNVSAADAAATVAFAGNSVVGASGNTTVSFTLPLALANTDTIDITFPAHVDITSAAYASHTFGGGNDFSCADSSQVLTCTADGAINAGTATLVLSGVVTDYVATTDITSFEVEATGTAANDIATDSAVALTDSTVGALTSTNVEPANLLISDVVAHTISFTTTAPTPADGIIRVTYPTGWVLAAADGETATSLSGFDGTITASVSGQVLTLTRSGGSESAAGAKSLTIANIGNPPFTGSGGSYAILTLLSDDSTSIQTDATVTADSIIGKAKSIPVLKSPTGVSVSDADSGVKITWTDPAENDSTHVQILKGTGSLPVNGTPIATVEIGNGEYIDTDVKDGETVKYILRATDGQEVSPMTEELSFVVGSGATVVETETTTETDTETTTETETDTDTTTETDTETESETKVTIEIKDVSNHWAKTEITALVEKSVVKGDPDGNFRPDDSLNRAESSALLFRVLGMEDPTEDPAKKPFSDVATDAWYAKYLDVLKSKELVNGNPDGTYKPASNINRAEFLTLAMNVYYYMADDDKKAEIDALKTGAKTTMYSDLADSWYTANVTAATELGFVNGSTCGAKKCFNAASNITRAEATAILHRMFNDML